MRIVSLLPSATEMLFALGLDKEIVGISHECDFPPQACTKRIVMQSRIPHGAAPLQIDSFVREQLASGQSVYAVDAGLLEELAPDLIITQDLCHVCAASPDDLATALSRFAQRPEMLCLNPQDLGDVWRDILWVGEATCRGRQAEALVKRIGRELGDLAYEVHGITARPRVAFLEWLQPLYVGGHWVPEMIHRAGGEDVFGSPGTPSFRVSLADVVAAAPEVLFIGPCGYTAEQARQEYLELVLPEDWSSIPAVKHKRVYALEANSYFSRPGPRLVRGVEVLAKILHPSMAASREAERAVLPIAAAAVAGKRAASV
jgi:iron complex transport system substrate-binding protein